MIEDLEQNITGEGFWDYTRKNLDIMGITNKFFVNSNP